MDIRKAIENSLRDNFLSREESNEIVRELSATYLAPKERVDLIRYATKIGMEKADPSNYGYVMKWLKKMTDVLGNFGTDNQHNNAYFSHQDDIRKEVIRSLGSAGDSLDICVFTISENQIAEAIIARHRAGITVKIITDDEKMMDKGSDIFRFKAKGIPIKIDESNSHMHHKFALIDKKKVITGSYNWTRSASEVNNENIVITDNFRIARAFEDEFSRLWQEMKLL